MTRYFASRTTLAALFIVCAGIVHAQSENARSEQTESAQAQSEDARARVTGPRWTDSDELMLPGDYREWTFLSAGYGMTYGPAAAEAGMPPLFDNVFVLPEAYRVFVETGQWPDGTMFALEVRRATSESAINEQGKFQQDLAALEVSVRDSARFDGDWAYFDFTGLPASREPLPYRAVCYECHSTNAAVDNTFVQFYPTLIDRAKEFGVFHQTGFLQ